MSVQKSIEHELREITSYPDAPSGPKKFLIIEYEVVKTEIRRYRATLNEVKY